MTKTPAPYTFPLKSRAAIAAFLDRDGRYYRPSRYRFCWNVKAYGATFDGATMRKHNPGLDPVFDAAWTDWLEENDGAFWDFCEDAARYVTEDGYTSYPGDDQGEWDLSFEGRCGGWLVLERWRGRDMRDQDSADFLNRDEWPWDELVAFYRGIVCLDQDMTPAKASAEVEYQAAFCRECLEEDWRTDREAAAQALADSMTQARPDLTPAYA